MAAEQAGVALRWCYMIPRPTAASTRITREDVLANIRAVITRYPDLNPSRMGFYEMNLGDQRDLPSNEVSERAIRAATTEATTAAATASLYATAPAGAPQSGPYGGQAQAGPAYPQSYASQAQSGPAYPQPFPRPRARPSNAPAPTGPPQGGFYGGQGQAGPAYPQPVPMPQAGPPGPQAPTWQYDPRTRPDTFRGFGQIASWVLQPPPADPALIPQPPQHPLLPAAAGSAPPASSDPTQGRASRSASSRTPAPSESRRERTPRPDQGQASRQGRRHR